MEQNQNPYENPQNPSPYTMPVRPRPNHMETAALVLGIISAATCSCCYLSIPLAALAIVLALLSRGGKMKLSQKAKIAIILAIVGLVLTVILYTISFYIAFSEFGDIEGILRAYCEMYGLDYEALYGDMFQ